MTKITKAKKAKMEALRDLNGQELQELRELQRIGAMQHFLAEQVRLNTAMVPDGQKYAEQLLTTARLCDQYKNNWMTQKFAECGYKPGVKCSVDLATGKISAV